MVILLPLNEGEAALTPSSRGAGERKLFNFPLIIERIHSFFYHMRIIQLRVQS
jgi:hypothetical protein